MKPWTWRDEWDLIAKEIGGRNAGPWRRKLGSAINTAQYRGPGFIESHGRDMKFRKRVLERMWTPSDQGGLAMEDTAAMLAATNMQLTEAKQTMQTLVNDLKAAADVIGPAILKHVQELRSARMTVVTEVRESLAAMREVRKFFLKPEYKDEMARLERFVLLCRDLQALKREGVLDAVADTAIRLAVQETQP